jgi:hypothetical protein
VCVCVCACVQMFCEDKTLHMCVYACVYVYARPLGTSQPHVQLCVTHTCLCVCVCHLCVCMCELSTSRDSKCIHAYIHSYIHVNAALAGSASEQ